MESLDLRLDVLHTVAGRAVYVHHDGTLFIGRGYNVHRSDDDGATWTEVAGMPCSFLRRVAEVSRPACRLLRHEVRALAVLSDGACVAANRKGVFHCEPGDRVMRPSRWEKDGTAAMPPMRIGTGPGDRVLWGEYLGNPQRRAVRLYVSDDGGQSFDVAHVFAAGTIRHVHNVVYDEQMEHYWVLVGDHRDEPGIGRLSADLKEFDWLVKGSQQYRAVNVLDLGDRLVYGTDTELEPNAVMSLDKRTGQAERLMPLEGSCLHACRFGKLYALSTSVEPSPVNTSRTAALWLSRDGSRWQKAFEAPKDRWNEKYFQYGSLVLPGGASDRDVILFAGQALRSIDGQVIVARLADPEGPWPGTRGR